MAKTQANILSGFRSKELLTDSIKIQEASEPLNIIWEHKHIKGPEFTLRLGIVLLIVSLVLFFSFSAIVYLK